MKMNPRLMTATVTIFAAVATAHLMQRNGAEASRIPPEVVAAQIASAGMIAVPAQQNARAVPEPAPVSQPAAAATPVPVPVAVSAPASDPIAPRAAPDLVPTPAVAQANLPLPRPPADIPTPASLPMTGSSLHERMAATTTTTGPATAPLAKAPKRNEFGLTCGTILSASVQPAAMVNLTLTSPCRGEERITVQHGGLSYSAQMTHLGTYSAEIPALARDAEFTVVFPDGEETSTEIEVPLAATIERIALQSGVTSGLQVHALEFGADYGEAGHVWYGAPGDAETAGMTGGGFLTALGDSSLEDAQVAEVYTFPFEHQSRDGVIRLSVEVEVTAMNCATGVAGQILQKREDGTMRPVAVTLEIPDCDAVGEYLVLKNLLRDLKIASN